MWLKNDTDKKVQPSIVERSKRIQRSMMSKRRFLKDREAVSPVIAVILMVAITIILIAILWLWVGSFLDTSKTSNPTASCTYKKEGDVYEISIDQVSDKIAIQDIKIEYVDANDVDLIGVNSLIPIYGKEIDDTNDIVFHDNDRDALLSIGDKIIIKSDTYISINGEKSPGPGRSGTTFSMIYANTNFMEKVDIGA